MTMICIRTWSPNTWTWLGSAVACFPTCFSERECVAAVYNEAFAEKVREGDPVSSYAIDRRCLKGMARATADDKVESLVCIWCACVYPRVEGIQRIEISWYQSCEFADRFFKRDRDTSHRLQPVETYKQKYGVGVRGVPELRDRQEELQDGTCEVPFQKGDINIICCPEDRSCDDVACASGRKLCARCWIPMCSTCDFCVDAPPPPRLPHCALADDMMVFYAPRSLYVEETTTMEMICASTCITSMICFFHWR